MQGSFIRNLDFRYKDPIQKVIVGEVIPNKFKQNSIIASGSFDDYKKKPNIKIIRPHSSKPQPQLVQQSCLTRVFSCLKLELCHECRSELCVECQSVKLLKLFICDVCEEKLCPSCRRNLQGKKVKLRNYRINLKNVKELHFKDCSCEDCLTEREKH